MGDDGQLKDSSHRPSGSLVKFLGQLHPKGMISEVEKAFILYNILISI